MPITVIRRRDPARRMARFYQLALQGVLEDPAACDLIREWGRIGSPGTVRADPHASIAAAQTALEQLERSKRRKGYA